MTDNSHQGKYVDFRWQPIIAVWVVFHFPEEGVTELWDMVTKYSALKGFLLGWEKATVSF